jgi:hypothetical protein
VLVGLPQGAGDRVFLHIYILLVLFYFVLFLFYFYNTHQVLILGPPQGIGGLAILFYFILFYFILVYFNYHAPGARRALPRGWWPCYLFDKVSFSLFL